MPADRGPVYVPHAVLTQLRHALKRARPADDPTGYQVAAEAAGRAYAEGYADGWRRGQDEAWPESQRRPLGADELAGER